MIHGSAFAGVVALGCRCRYLGWTSHPVERLRTRWALQGIELQLAHPALIAVMTTLSNQRVLDISDHEGSGCS